MWALTGSSLFLCNCHDFLDAKPYNTLAQPNKIEDLRALLDYEAEMSSWYPGLGEVASDDFQVDYKGLSSTLPVLQDTYLWRDKGMTDGEWMLANKVISISNVVLEGLERVKGGPLNVREQLEGEALFWRGWVFFNLAQIYCPPFTVLEPSSGLGLVLRTDSDSEIDQGRSTLAETYRQLLEDLHKSVELLPETSQFITRPSKLVALAALARVYLTIEDYAKSEEMVDRVMQITSELLDFNDLDPTAAIPISMSNNIELFNFAQSWTVSFLMLEASTHVDPRLYERYEDSDLRKHIFFEENVSGVKFKGSYHGQPTTAFFGLAQDEMYLIKAECLARRSAFKEGESYLNTLLNHRYKRGEFSPISFTDSDALLTRVLLERRKELIFRGLRWMDLRRLNRYPERAITLKRQFNDEPDVFSYLEPQDLRYTFLFPIEAIDAGGYEQNPR